MIDLFGPLRRLTRAVRRLFSRRLARRLVADQLPRGLLPAPERPLTLALRVPVALEAPEGELWFLPLLAHAVRGRPPQRLLRLSALPPPPRALGVVRPAHFRLDKELRLPTEVDPLRIAPDAPSPLKPRHVRPRTPLARAPIWRLRMRPFRLDPRSQQGPNEGILPLEPRDPSYRWVLPAFKRRFVDLPPMARFRVAFRGPTTAEWFQRWWDQVTYQAPGAKDPRCYKLDKEIEWAMEERKEQMLIRRGVKKDEEAPPFQDFSHLVLEHAITAREFHPLDDLIPPKEWVEVADITLPPAAREVTPREAYLQWRTLIDSLEER